MVVSGMEYSELQRRNQLGRLKQKLAAKQAAEQAAAAPASGNLDAAADAEAAAAIVPESTPDPSTEPVDEAARLAALKAIQRIEEEQRRVAEKAAKGDKAVTQDMLRAAGEASQKVCNVGKVSVHTQDGSADLSPQERARLSAAIGNGKAQNVRCWTNARGQALTIDEGVVDPLEGATAALVFSGCAGCTYTVATTCAKIFLRHCVDFEIVLAEGSRVLTQTLEAERCERTKIRVSTRVCTLQIEQCKSVIVDVTKREHFGNTTMMHKGRDFGEICAYGARLWGPAEMNSSASHRQERPRTRALPLFHAFSVWRRRLCACPKGGATVVTAERRHGRVGCAALQRALTSSHT
eukprot:TRINITY_DN1264_c0_g1_i1.p1 TRINITY_DN1264_c0_g1~~TRINITY_DN1264_c0_g1_i1.p1  ORF type:complete len:351 (+),score=95.98 TRINITY_DN1264_c0_g1_i1:180-1232(+)